MTEQEAKTILRIMNTADGDCSWCAKCLHERFIIEFPQFKELADKIYKEAHE